MATISKTPAGTFKAVIRSNGRIIKTKTFKLKKHAREWAKRIEGDNDALEAFGCPGATIIFSDLADEYLEQWTGNDSINGAVMVWKANLGDKVLTDIKAPMIREVLDRYAAGEAKRFDGIGPDGKPRIARAGRNRAPATVNRTKATLSSIFRYAVKVKGYIDENPCRLVASLPENNRRVRYLSDDERKALVAACKASEWDKLYLLVLLALTTGARQGELLGLHWNDIDFIARTATLHHTKNGESRVLTFPPVAIAELSKFREVGAGLVFPSAIKWRKPFEFRKHWNKALVQAGIEDFKFHDLRHSAASMLVMNGATLYETAEVLGHKSVQTTARYAHLSTDHKQELTDRIMGEIDL